ncbi:CsbD family protein [Flexivirga caeni]|uniref:CsbD family protein n=1 Tax=Flexivirga caeni TaxID=2294115 RepID=A0A3M9MBI4_9MICO|nr:CsbD family protein [Flexivirga caeni]RNI22932.1 CsbD family protein [Flexivirga caeni]
MGMMDKAKNAAQKAAGEVKETVGKHTDNADLQAEGKKDQVAGDAKDAGEKVKDAFKN